MIGTATPELVFTATTDAAQWVQIYGLLRPTDSSDEYMFRILHLKRKTNVEVLEMAKAKQTLLKTLQERKLQYFEHLIRGKGKET